VHIYCGQETIERVLATLNKGKTLLVFKDTDSLDSFVKSLSSTNKALILVKLYIDRENLLIGTPSDMEKIIK
jgi:hypothetical protein